MVLKLERKFKNLEFIGPNLGATKENLWPFPINWQSNLFLVSLLLEFAWTTLDELYLEDKSNRSKLLLITMDLNTRKILNWLEF